MALGQQIRAGEAFVEVGLRDKVSAGLAKIQARAKAFADGATRLGRGMIAVGTAIAAPLIASVKVASDVEETMNKFNVVFGRNKEVVKQWGDTFAGEVGRSKQQIADFLAGTQDLLVPIGFDDASATKFSKDITQLSVDLASFNNKADADVLRDLHAALTGSGEVMKKYGVIVSEAAVKQELLNQGLDPKLATEQQKVQARMNIIMRGTTAAQGDAIRSAGSFANQMKALKANVADAAAEIGGALLPVITPLLVDVVDMVKGLADWISENDKLVVKVAKWAAGLVVAGAALIAVAKIITTSITIAMGLATAIKAVSAAVAFMGGPLTIAIAGAAALVAGFAMLIDRSAEAAEAVESATSAVEAFERAEKARLNANRATIQSLEELAAAGKLNNEQLDEAERLLQQLRGTYGNFGAEVDRATGTITNSAHALAEFNKAQNDTAIDSNRRQMRVVSQELRKLEAERDELLEGDWFTLGLTADNAAVDEVLAGIERLQKKYLELHRSASELRKQSESIDTGEDLTIALGRDAEDKLTKLDAAEAKKRESSLDREIRQIRELTHERLRLLDTIIAGAEAEGDEKKVLGLTARREGLAVASEAQVQHLRQEEARRREQPNLEARREIERLKVELELDGVEEQIALLKIDLKEALAAAAEQGLDQDLVRQRFALEEQLLRKGAEIGSTVRATASVTGIEQARGLSGRAAPEKLEEKQLKQQQQIALYTGQAVEHLEHMRNERQVFGP